MATYCKSSLIFLEIHFCWFSMCQCLLKIETRIRILSFVCLLFSKGRLVCVIVIHSINKIRFWLVRGHSTASNQLQFDENNYLVVTLFWFIVIEKRWWCCNHDFLMAPNFLFFESEVFLVCRVCARARAFWLFLRFSALHSFLFAREELFCLVFSRWYLHIWLTKKSFSTCGFQSAVSQSHTHTHTHTHDR